MSSGVTGVWMMIEGYFKYRPSEKIPLIYFIICLALFWISHLFTTRFKNGTKEYREYKQEFHLWDEYGDGNKLTLRKLLNERRTALQNGTRSQYLIEAEAVFFPDPREPSEIPQ